MEEQRPLDRSWDYLIILDACRFDVFEEVYDDFLEGRLRKVESVGSSTPEWAYKNFTDSYDLTYFSSNPFINGSGVPISEVGWGSSCGYEWSAEDHIENVVDVWQDYWDEDLGTVRPEAINEAVKNNQDKIEETERTIIHYMQPHAPFISSGKGRKNDKIRESFQDAREKTSEKSFTQRILNTVVSKIEPLFQRSELVMKIGMWVELNPSSLFKVGRYGTRETVEDYYIDNLELALEEVVALIEELEGEVVITSDHGEAFGEQGIWEHHVETHIPPLVEVPWLEVEDTK